VIRGHGGGPQFDSVIVKLTAALKEIEDSLAEPRADEA
jgi:hypothetical protein